VTRIITTISLQPEDRDALSRLTEVTGCSRSEVIRTAIRRLEEASSKASRPEGNRTAREKSLERSDREPESTLVSGR
jgi:hypothetical protein